VRASGGTPVRVVPFSVRRAARLGLGEGHSTVEAGQRRWREGPSLQERFRRSPGEVIGDEPSNTEPDPDASEEAVPQGEGGLSVSLAVNPVGEPDAGNPHVRFDERGLGNGTTSESLPRPPSTLLKTKEVDGMS
jgi:hypothetical protein